MPDYHLSPVTSADAQLFLDQAREHSDLTAAQLQRDGRIFDSMSKMTFVKGPADAQLGNP
jgi:hypothetical protein